MLVTISPYIFLKMGIKPFISFFFFLNGTSLSLLLFFRVLKSSDSDFF